MKKTLLLVFIHGFKGSDHTFHNFPKDLRALLAHTLPNLTILTIQYPQYETRGDLKTCVTKFKEWLQNKVIDLEVHNRTPSPTVDPSVHVVLCGHSMGGIVAAETLLSIARDEPVPYSSSYANDTTNSTTRDHDASSRPVRLGVPEQMERPSSAPPLEPTTLFFPYIEAILAFDTPYLGISPGVLAHGAEVQINHASTAYKAFDTASKLFGWNTPGGSTPQPIPNASSKALPAASDAGGWQKWGTYAMVGGAAAAMAGIAGAAYLSWNQINQGLEWASSHLEFVGCLARGAELQKRVESIVELTRTRNVGFANFYGALGEKVTNQTKYAGAVLGEDRTFCVVPKNAREDGSPVGTKRSAPSGEQPPPKRRASKSDDPRVTDEVEQGQRVQDFAGDVTKSKGHWVRCVNNNADDELVSHTSMFASDRNPDYFDMVARARDQIAQWVDATWYDTTADDKHNSEERNSQTKERHPQTEE